MMEFPKQATGDVHKMDDDDECNYKMSKDELVVAEDMILEILLHLPPVSVIKFKRVCKSWYSLISNPCFLRYHARQFHLKLRFDPLVVMEMPPGFLLSPDSRCSICSQLSVYAILPQDQEQDQDEYAKPFLDHSLHAFEQKNSSYFLVDSCNGLLLYYSRNLNSDTPHLYKLFNPITNQYKDVPIMDLLRNFIEPNEENEEVLLYYPHIVFDPSISPYYKVLTVVRGHTHFQFYVYSSETGSWRLLTSFAKKYAVARATFMFNGVFYWLGKEASIFYDVVKDSVVFLPMPPIPEGYPNREVLYLGECGGRLRLIEGYPGRVLPCSFNIMELEEGSTIWTVKSRVNIEGGCDHIEEVTDPYHLALVKVMYLYETEKGEEVVLLNVDYQRIVSFNITTNTFEKDLTIPYFEHCGCLSAFPFAPTLFPLLT